LNRRGEIDTGFGPSLEVFYVGNKLLVESKESGETIGLKESESQKSNQ